MIRYWRNWDYGDTDSYWWGAPTGWTDYNLYDYNNNFVLDDNEIEDLVYDNIRTDPGITYSDADKISISVKDGVVTLRGEVRNPRTKPLAYADAYWSSGVTDVVNQINVRERKRRETGDSKSSA
ncbi:MAG: BON domain-containing protein [Patescibacteria group bacterium]